MHRSRRMKPHDPRLTRSTYVFDATSVEGVPDAGSKANRAQAACPYHKYDLAQGVPPLLGQCDGPLSGSGSGGALVFVMAVHGPLRETFHATRISSGWIRVQRYT